jgi:hypothetical protein
MENAIRVRASSVYGSFMIYNSAWIEVHVGGCMCQTEPLTTSCARPLFDELNVDIDGGGMVTAMYAEV